MQSGVKILPSAKRSLIVSPVPPIDASPPAPSPPDTGVTTVDACIIGQGIAGSLLGYVLHRRGLRVRVVDDGHKSSASLVAAGMINPVQGQKLNLIWEIERCMPAALALYRELEAHFGKPFFFPRKILKLLKTQAQAQTLGKHLQNPAFAPWLGAVYPPDYFKERSCPAAPAAVDNDGAIPASLTANNALCDPFGSFEILGGGYLDTPQLLRTLRDYFRSEGVLIEMRFAHADLNLSDPACVRWQGLEARKIIFAEGWRILENPLFAHYTFVPTKGQILTVQADAPLPSCVLNHGKWLVPQGAREAWIGATYERHHTDALPTAEGAAEILTEVQSLIPRNPLRVRSQRAGIRLATPDYIPRIGFLPTDARIGIFSAFSSKGNCFAPYLSNCMAEHMVNGAALPRQADIANKKLASKKKANGDCAR